MAKAQQNTSPVAFVNQITDPHIRAAVLEVFKQLGVINGRLSSIGQLTAPLTTALNASNNQLKRLQDPSDPQDAVTLRYLQTYVANFAATFSGNQAQAGGSDGEPTSPDEPPVPVPDHLDVVTAIWNLAPLGPSSPEVDLYRFVQAVANALLSVDPPLTCGLLHKPTGANIYTCAGETYSIARICYDNGQVYKIVIDADPGGQRLPGWAYNGLLLDDYRDVTASGSC